MGAGLRWQASIASGRLAFYRPERLVGFANSVLENVLRHLLFASGLPRYRLALLATLLLTGCNDSSPPANEAAASTNNQTSQTGQTGQTGQIASAPECPVFAPGTFALLGDACSNVPPADLRDGFESRDLLAPASPAPALNRAGFGWHDSNYASVVGIVDGQPTRVWADGPTADRWPGHDFRCISGSFCLRLRYPAGNFMAEQRFSLGRPYADLWLRYWLRVPGNFSHGAQNNKLAALWMQQYDGPGDVTWQTRPNAQGGAQLLVQDGGVAVPEITAAGQFIRVPADRGRWMQVVIHLQPATAPGANNGVIEFFRRWQDETAFRRLYRKSNAGFSDPGGGVRYGYLMGWANEPYAEETEWLIDDVTVSGQSLLGGAAIVDGAP